MNTKQFTHLHCHDNFSLLDGYGKPIDRAKKASELGMSSLATTNHNSLGGCIDFQLACKEYNIKPILGVELYYTEDTSILIMPPEQRIGMDIKTCKKKSAENRKKMAIEKAMKNGVVIPKKATQKQINALIADYEYNTKQFHILFLAKNQTGWNNLIRLQSEAARICTYNGNFCCDDDLIDKYKEGLIMTTACVGGIVNNYILKGELDKAINKIKKWKTMFGDDFYLEIQPLNFEKQCICNNQLIKYAIENNIKTISTNDVHYTNKEQYDDHDTLLCIGLKKKKSDTTRMKYDHEFWMRSYDEMIEAYTNQYNNSNLLQESFSKNEYVNFIMQSLEYTNEISDKVDDNIKLKSDTPILPKVEIPNNLTAEDYLTSISFKNLFSYLSKNKNLDIDEYVNRLYVELNVINTKGYADYILIVKDMIDWCKKNNIPTGPGRGSASGSLVLFVNELTKCVDPIKYNLLFSRFLTMDRTSLPDVDSDFSYVNRYRVIDYLKAKYGENCVSYIGTYTELKVKNSLKDIGRVLDINFDIMNAISKEIDKISDESPDIKFKDLDDLKNGTPKEVGRYKQFKELENKYPEVFRLARAFESTPRNQSIHASGILVTPMPINNMFPTRVDDDGSLVTLYTGPQVEAINGVKIDILGLRTLDVLDYAIKAVDSTKNIYDLYDIVNNHLEDEDLFIGLNNKETEGIFQLESDMFKGLISDAPQNSIEDITVLTSIGKAI